MMSHNSWLRDDEGRFAVDSYWGEGAYDGGFLGDAEVLERGGGWTSTREQRREAFRARLVANRDCSRPVARHSSKQRWRQRCLAAGAQRVPPVGDVAALQKIETTNRRVSEREAAIRGIQAANPDLRRGGWRIRFDQASRACHHSDDAFATAYADAGRNDGSALAARRAEGKKTPAFDGAQ